MNRAYLKAGYFLRLIHVVTRIGLVIKPHQRLVKRVSRAALLVLRITDATSGWTISAVIKATVNFLLHVVNASRPDADAEFAMEILHAVHGGRGLSAPMFKERIIEQMCREPDEERSYYCEVDRRQMCVMFYNLPSGARLRFIMFEPEETVVGWKIVHPGVRATSLPIGSVSEVNLPASSRRKDIHPFQIPQSPA